MRSHSKLPFESTFEQHASQPSLNHVSKVLVPEQLSSTANQVPKSYICIMYEKFQFDEGKTVSGLLLILYVLCALCFVIRIFGEDHSFE
jgi:hypothetical protein